MESVTIVGECLKVLMLLQAVSRDSECQKCILNLLLEAIVMVFSASEECPSQVTLGRKMDSWDLSCMSLNTDNNELE